MGWGWVGWGGESSPDGVGVVNEWRLPLLSLHVMVSGVGGGGWEGLNYCSLNHTVCKSSHFKNCLQKGWQLG